MKNRLNDFLASEFARNVAIVAFGAAGAQIVTMAFTPVITRLYGPTVYGIAGTFTAATAMLLPLMGLAYPTSIVIARDDSEAKDLYRISIYLAALTSALMLVAVVIGRRRLTEMVAVAPIAPYLVFIPVALFLQAQLAAAQQWSIRQRSFPILAKVAFLQSVLVNGARAIGGALHPSALVLVAVSMLGPALHSLLLIRAEKAGRSAPQLGVADSGSLFATARKYSDFPLFRAPQNLVSALSLGAPVVFLGALFGPASAGFYALAQTVLGLPAALLGKAVVDVLYPHLAEASRSGAGIRLQLLNTTAALALVGAVPFGIIIAGGPEVFGFVFGSEWAEAGQYAQWISILLFFNFISKPAVAAVPVLAIQKGLLVYELLSTTGKIGAFLFTLYVSGNDVAAVAAFSIAGSVSYVAMVSWIFGVAVTREATDEAG